MANSEERIVALIDMDCFFCQVEAREHPDLRDKPMVVSQFNLVLAVNYEARDRGVSRFVRADEAKEQCADLNVISVPVVRGKGDVSKYRAAGQEVIDVLKQHCSKIERASVDEAYLDLTSLVESRMATLSCSTTNLLQLLPNTFVVGHCDGDNDEKKRREGLESWLEAAHDHLDDLQLKLAVAAVIVEEFRAKILEKCKFKCSAGISYNKVLAKLACGLHKPNRQTVLPPASVPALFSTVSIDKVRNLGGKVGKFIVEDLRCKVMADLLRFSLADLQKQFDEKTGLWLYNIARGVDNEPVTPRLISKSIGSSKNFPGQQAITNLETLTEWVDILTEDLSNRLQQDLLDNRRRATTLTISYQFCQDDKTVSQSRTVSLPTYKAERLASLVLDIVAKFLDKSILALSVATNKFVGIQNSTDLTNYFKSSLKPSESSDSSINPTKSMQHISQAGHGNQNDEFVDLSVSNLEVITQGAENYVKKEAALIQLEEIFPDLENIDLSVVQLLPEALQKQAQTYLKSKRNFFNVQKTCGKLPSPKAGTKTKNSKTLDHFFARPTEDEASSMIRCSECSQMVNSDKYSEHKDFHVAKNLQKEINFSPVDRVPYSSKRNHIDPNSTLKSNKRRSIASYFTKIDKNS